MKQTKRPLVIWIVCILGFIGAAISIPMAITGWKYVGAWYGLLTLASIIVGILSLIGVFKMKRWGAQLYVWMFLVIQAILAFKGFWSWEGLIVPLVYVVLILIYYRRMN